MQTRSFGEGERRGGQQAIVLAYAPPLVMDGAPLPNDASIQDFQQGKAGYVANAVKQSLLLPNDMADLRFMRKYEVFLGLKRDLAIVSILVLVFNFSLFSFFFFLTIFSSSLKPSKPRSGPRR